ncbi:MAG: hypothetical protein ACI30N_00490 [Muribaculaceae bacterium]
MDPKKNNATVYLRWEADDYTNGDITYTVQRVNNGTWETLATGLKRLEYFDVSVKPGESYYYYVSSSAGGHAQSETKTIPARNHADPVYTLNVEYEISFDQLLKDGWTNQGFHVPTLNNPGNSVSDVSWQAKGQVSDDYNNKFLPKSTYHENNFGTDDLAGYGPDYFYLDGNRYLWIKDGERSTGEKYYCEIPNFRVNGDQVESNEDIAKTTVSAERYPWAGVGYSWRSIMAGASNKNRVEKCWYINVRENNKYGVLCVWAPDQQGNRPYQGHPFYLDWAKFRSDYDGAFWDNTFGTTWPGRSGITNSADETYSVAFSDDGRSYLRRTGFGNIRRRSVFFSIHSNREQGRRHDWKPYRSDSRYTYLRSDKDSDLPGGKTLDEGVGRADLINVKGNLNKANYTDGSDPTQNQNYAWIWQITNYGSANNQVIVRGDRINRDGDITKGDRIRLQGFDNLYGTNSGYIGNQNYVVPMSGQNCDDIFVQLSNSGRSTPSESYPHLWYLHSSVVNSTDSPSKNSEYYTITRNVTNASDVQRIDLGLQYNHIVGGCTFDFKGEKFLILAATRQGDYNMGDFTIFRIDGRTGNSDVTLTPVVNYTSPAIRDKQWSSTAGIGANPNRTFIRTFLKKENRPGFDNTDEYVEIYLYLPGRTINMYTFYGTIIPEGYPKVQMLPNIVTSEAYLVNDGHQHITNYDAVTGVAHEQHSDNTQAPHLKEYYTHIDWTQYRGDTYNNSGSRDTKILLSELQSTNYLQDVNGNWQGYYDYAHRPSAGNDNLWKYGEHIGGAYGTSIWTRPEYKRNVGLAMNQNNQPTYATQTLYGNSTEANSRYYYNPEPVKALTAKAYKDKKQEIYRVDINFDAPNPVWGHNTNDNVYTRNDPQATKEDGWYEIPVTRYEISIDGQDGLTGKALNNIAYVMTGSKQYPKWKNGTYSNVYNYAVQAKDRSVSTPGSTKCIVIPGNYDIENNRKNALAALGPGYIDDENEPCLLTIISTDKDITKYTYRVRTVYGTDNWNGGKEAESAYGVSKYVDRTATPTGYTLTGVDDIMADADEGSVEYFSLQGIRLNGEPAAPGVYLRRTAAGVEKVYIR